MQHVDLTSRLWDFWNHHEYRQESNVMLRERRVSTIFVAKIHMSHCSPRSYTQLFKKKVKLNRRHEVLAKNITFNVEQPVLSVKRVAAVQIVVPVDNELDDRIPILKNLLFIWRYCSYDLLTNEFNCTANETSDSRYSRSSYTNMCTDTLYMRYCQ